MFKKKWVDFMSALCYYMSVDKKARKIKEQDDEERIYKE